MRIESVDNLRPVVAVSYASVIQIRGERLFVPMPLQSPAQHDDN
jgi:hypothetical protein